MNEPRASVSGLRRPASGITIDVERLVRMRQERSWEREDLAREAGLSVSMIGQIETRARRPRAATLAAICEALGCTPADLLPELERA